MKTLTGLMAILAVATLVTAGPAFAGQAQSEKGAAPKGTADAARSSAWQGRPAVETGTYPADVAGSQKTVAPAKDDVPTIEIAGVKLRVGIDTN